jgi:cysteine desulfurase
MSPINNLIYFNNNRSTVPDKLVREAMRLASDKMSEETRVLSNAENSLAALIGSTTKEIAFTDGTSASIALGIRMLYNALKSKGGHIITCAVEHPAVLAACHQLEKEGAQLSIIGVNREGLIDLEELKAAITPRTVMTCLMAANNETGVLFPVQEIGAICRENNIVFFSDASQFLGKERCVVNDIGFDCLAFGSHKMYGPTDIGALFVGQRLLDTNELLRENFANLKHTFSKRKENVVLAAGFAKATEIAANEYWETNTHLSRLRNYFEHQLLDIPGLRINGSTRYRLCNTSNLFFPEGEKLLPLRTRFDFASNHEKPSHVLRAMGLSEEDNRNSFRFSFGRYNTLDEVKLLVSEILKLYITV